MEREIVWRQQVQPGLNVVVEDSLNILLEITTPDGREVIARSAPLSNGDTYPAVLTMARVFVAEMEHESYGKRAAWVQENTVPKWHAHRHEGQTLRHKHLGGHEPHGYFGHPEDTPPTGVERSRHGLFGPDGRINT